jgi:hypothetical protein
MSKIDLQELLRTKMVAADGDDTPVFKFERIGDQIIAKFKG